MKPTLKPVLALLTFSALAVLMLAEQPQAVLGKINFAALYDAAPLLPASTAEAGKRVYGMSIAENSTANLEPFYEPYNKRIEAAHNVIKGAVESRSANREALGQRAVAQANESPLISRMGGTQKMAEMSDAELEQAAAQAVGSYQQSMSGGPPNPASRK